jgi:hypothetical protein
MVPLQASAKAYRIGRCIATGLNDGSVYTWDVQDGRKIRQVMLDSQPQGSLSCLTWIAEDPSYSKRDANLVIKAVVYQLIRRISMWNLM